MNNIQRSAVVVALLTNFVAPFMTGCLNLNISDISTYFHCAPAAATWISNVYTLAVAMFSLPLGHLADIKGRRTMIMIGSALYGLFAVICACAVNEYMLMAGRLLMGIAAGTFLGAGIPFMLSFFDKGVHGRYVGYAVGAVSLGAVCGPSVGGFVNAIAGWRGIFALPIIICIVVFVLTWRACPADKTVGAEGENDLGGNVLFILGVGAAMLGLGELNSQIWAPAAMVIGLVIMIFFVRHENRVSQPMLQVSLFKESRAYMFCNLATFTNFLAIYAIVYVLGIHLQNIYHMSSATAGALIMIQSIIQAAFSPLCGRLSDRFDPRLIAGIGSIIVAIGLGIFCSIFQMVPLWVVAIGLLFTGLGAAFFGSSNTSAILACVDFDRKSEANATISTMRGGGQCVALAISGIIFTSLIGATTFSEADPTLLIQADTMIMGISCVFSLVCAACSFLARR